MIKLVSSPNQTSINWYAGNTINNLIGQYNKAWTLSNSKYAVIGPDILAAAEPVIAKTIKIMIAWKFDSISHLFFNFSNI